MFDDGWPTETVTVEVDSVIIWAGACIDAIQFSYRDQATGRPQPGGARHGGESGSLKFNHRLRLSEDIIAVSGRYDAEVDAIQIHTNQGIYERIDGTGGFVDFRAEERPPAGPGEIVGIFGSAGHFLDPIGFSSRARTESTGQAHDCYPWSRRS